MNEYVENQSTLVFFISVLAIFSVLSEIGYEKLSHALHRSKSFLLPTLEAFTVQLMLLGLFSFLLFTAKKSGILEALGESVFKFKDGAVFIELGEDMHVIIFVGLCLYVAIVTVLVLIAALLVRVWQQSERRALDDVRNDFAALKRAHRYYSPWWWLKHTHCMYKLRYHEIRAHFISEFVGDEAALVDDVRYFSFAAYLTRALGDSVLPRIVAIHWSVWLLLVASGLVNWARYQLLMRADRFTPTLSPPFWITLSALFVLASFVLFLKCYLVFRTMSRVTRRDASHASLLHDRARQRRLFWFNSPTLMLRLIQITLLFQSWFNAGLVVFLPAQTPWPAPALVAVFAPQCFLTLLFAPLVLPLYAVIAFAGPHANAELIERVIDDAKEAERLQQRAASRRNTASGGGAPEVFIPSLS